jgi:hypothetical protein
VQLLLGIQLQLQCLWPQQQQAVMGLCFQGLAQPMSLPAAAPHPHHLLLLLLLQKQASGLCVLVAPH